MLGLLRVLVWLLAAALLPPHHQHAVHALHHARLSNTLVLEPEVLLGVNQIDESSVTDQMSRCANKCSGLGRCELQQGTEQWQCVCDPGWGGSDCSTRQVAEQQGHCPHSCSEHGNCIMHNGAYACDCFDGWIDDDCSTRVVAETTSGSSSVSTLSSSGEPTLTSSSSLTVSAMKSTDEAPTATNTNDGPATVSTKSETSNTTPQDTLPTSTPTPTPPSTSTPTPTTEENSNQIISPSQQTPTPTPIQTPVVLPLADCTDTQLEIVDRCVKGTTNPSENCNLEMCHIVESCDCVTTSESAGDSTQTTETCGMSNRGVCLPREGALLSSCTYRSNVVSWVAFGAAPGAVTIQQDGECPPELATQVSAATQPALASPLFVLLSLSAILLIVPSWSL